jgi:hypothetical protein
MNLTLRRDAATTVNSGCAKLGKQKTTSLDNAYLRYQRSAENTDAPLLALGCDQLTATGSVR